jgi:hypothetical protein
MPVISVALAFWGAATGPMYPADFQPSTAGSRHRFPFALISPCIEGRQSPLHGVDAHSLLYPSPRFQAGCRH